MALSDFMEWHVNLLITLDVALIIFSASNLILKPVGKHGVRIPFLSHQIQTKRRGYLVFIFGVVLFAWLSTFIEAFLSNWASQDISYYSIVWLLTLGGLWVAYCQQYYDGKFF